MARHKREEPEMGTILLVVLVLMVLGALPTWSHSRSWGYAPSGGLGLVVLVLVVVLSYRQIIKAYQSGGGDYEVASKNLGEKAGLVVASALLGTMTGSAISNVATIGVINAIIDMVIIGSRFNSQ